LERVSKDNEKKELNSFMKRLLENVGNRADYFTEKLCRKCQRYYACFPEGYTFKYEEINKCERLPEIVKIWYQARQINLIIADYPFKIQEFKVSKRFDIWDI